MMQTLIGADGVVMTLSGRIEISWEDYGRAPGAALSTVIEARPGIGVKPQRIVLKGLQILDVETVPERDYANYPGREWQRFVKDWPTIKEHLGHFCMAPEAPCGGVPMGSKPKVTVERNA